MKRSFLSRLPRISFSTVVTSLISLLIIALPLVVNHSTLPMGWELPKVYAFQIFMIFLIIAVAGYLIVSFIKKPRLPKINIFLVVMLILMAAVLIATTLQSSFTRPFFEYFIENPLYRVILPNADTTQKIALFGNQFRDFGLISVALVIALILISKRFITPQNYKLIILAFVISAAIQAVLGIWQFIELIRVDVLSPYSGEWVFGTFGQGNFYAGHLLVGLVLAMHLLKQSFRKAPALLLTITIIIGILVSFSMGSFILMVGTIALILGYEILPRRTFKTATLVIGAIAIIGTLIFSYSLMLKPNPGHYRTIIWRNVTHSYITVPASDLSNSDGIQKMLIGTGFDTLGEVLVEENRIEGNFVDRAHNIFLDILSATGITGLLIFSAFLLFIGIAVIKGNSPSKPPFIIYTAVAAFIWLSRSYIHTNSVANIVDFAVLAGTLTAYARSAYTSSPKRTTY